MAYTGQDIAPKSFDTYDKNEIDARFEPLESAVTDVNTGTAEDIGFLSIPETAVEGYARFEGMDGLTVTNLVENGDFSDVYSAGNPYFTPLGWYPPTITMDTSIKHSGVQSAKLVKSTSGVSRGGFGISSSAIGNVYYLSSWIYISENITGYSYGIYQGSNSIVDNRINLGTCQTGVWLHFQSIFTAIDTTSLIMGFPNILEGVEVYFDDINIIDLTTTFGAGNEPSEADCLKIFPSYFSGTQSVQLPMKIVSEGKNLFDGELERGAFSDINGLDQVNNNYIRNKNHYLQIAPSTTYSFWNSASITNIAIYYYDINKNFISVSKPSTNPATLTTPANAKFINFRYIGTDLGTLVMLELGSTATTYEPYRSATQYLTDDEEVRSALEAKDEIFWSDGALWLRRNVGTISFDGTENWLQSGASGAFYLNATALSGVAYVANTVVWNVYSPSYRNGIAYVDYASYDDFIYINVDSLGIKDTTYADVATWKAHLASLESTGTPLTANYQLATPTETKLTTIGNLVTYDGGRIYIGDIVADELYDGSPAVQNYVFTEFAVTYVNNLVSQVQGNTDGLVELSKQSIRQETDIQTLFLLV